MAAVPPRLTALALLLATARPPWNAAACALLTASEPAPMALALLLASATPPLAALAPELEMAVPPPTALALLLEMATPLPWAAALDVEMAVPPPTALAWELATAVASSLRPAVQHGSGSGVRGAQMQVDGLISARHSKAFEDVRKTASWRHCAARPGAADSCAWLGCTCSSSGCLHTRQPSKQARRQPDRHAHSPSAASAGLVNRPANSTRQVNSTEVLMALVGGERAGVGCGVGSGRVGVCAAGLVGLGMEPV